MKTLAAEGIVLRRLDYGEADRIITILTNNYGKIHAIAKGVRRSKSKLAGGIELFSVSEIHFIKGRGDIDTLTSTRLVINYGEIVKDLGRTELAYRMLKSADKLIEDHTGEEYFTVMHESLAAVNDSRIDPLLAELSFAMRLLQGQGHVPDFSSDNSGRRLDSEDRYEYDFEAVTFRSSPKGEFNKNHLKVLKLLAHNPPQAVAAVQGILDYCNDLRALVRSLAVQYLPS